MNHKLRAVVLNDTRVDLHHGCNRVMSALKHLMEIYNVTLLAASPAHCDWLKNKTLISALEASQLVIVNGEGTIHHDRLAGQRLLEVGSWARAKGIPAVLINCGWEGNGSEFADMAKTFALVSVRDSASASLLQAQGVDCCLVPDLSLYEGEWSQCPPRKDIMLFSDSVDGKKALWLDKARRVCGGELISIVYSTPELAGYLRFIRGPIAKWDLLQPKRVLALANLRRNLYRVSSQYGDHFMNRLASGSLLVSGRFHACTLALCTGTPFVAIPSNTGKISALIRDVGLERWRERALLDCKTLAEAKAAGWSALEKKNIQDYLAYARTSAETLFTQIRSLV
jgi:hypothetical protein